MAGKKGRSGTTNTRAKGPKRTNDQLILDRAETISLLRRGWTKTAIATKLGVHPTQISYDWKKILKELVAARDTDLEELIAIKLEEYAEIKREAWEAWERSKRERNRRVLESSSSSSSGGGDEDEGTGGPSGGRGSERTREILTTDDGQWSSEYLKTIVQCLNAERELRGLNPVKDAKPQNNTVNINWDVLASAIPPAGVPLPDPVEEKIMALLQEADPTLQDPTRQPPKQIPYIPSYKTVPPASALPKVNGNNPEKDH